MSDAASEPIWSDLQVSYLQALGHTVYLDRDAVDALPAAVEVAERVEMAAPARVERAPQSALVNAPVARRSAASASAEAPRAPSTTPAAAPQRRSRAGMPDRLQMALLRASGCNPGDPATQALMASWPLAELRGNPAAKRALWPQLRALRRRRDPA
ncbi:TPA: alanine acetyltransferase [Xanthomonas vasicola pv. zeae]|uniref:Alanine acetyltransferase n=1 Tax=Xanthomonas vasicola pv. vasculorum TaxID=325776 RepID=A0AAE8F5D9_XANVA|nr:alanine acetyltransferase [Xanthomonas vasicola]KFA38556.1 alanine acetyltransferase [Xanthomonas vasicola pv. musacearum NCPPB 4384]MBV6747541.1 DNA polymerase III subunit psi [Xanthomonas vasicola pv. vasculorum NCPPB 890]AVQ08248.1 alanine acetyltransferase [Xanthomonas vasicola pv. vasculorum]AZM72445.1 alanine acetyltransferase [Xanthomonas vasicola pv. vasculorum]AZR25602.1 alanine acetyltransferase [Xanthomonas vasicola pv. arecae]